MARIFIISCFVGLLAVIGTGCEERIVSENYSPYTGLSSRRYTTANSYNVENAGQTNENGFQKAWNEIDEALFGWLKDDKPTKTNNIPPDQHFDPIWMRQ